MTLLRQQLRSERNSLIGWSVATALFTWYMIAMFRMLLNSGTMADLAKMLDGLPEGYKALFEASDQLFTLQGWVQGAVYTGILPLVMLIFVGLYVTGLVTREMDQHTMDFLLSLPVERDRLIVARWFGMVINLAVLHLVHFATVVLMIGEEARVAEYFLADVNMWLVFVTLGGLLLVVSLFIDDYPRGVAVNMGLVAAIYFANAALEGGEGIRETLRKLLPFGYYDPSSIIAGGGLPLADVAVLILASMAFLGLAIYVFRRKQIAV